MPSIVVDATASLSANGTSTATGSISWTAPSFPEYVTFWDSVTISGKWTWTGSRTISKVTINGTDTTSGTSFSIPLDTDETSPMTITCVGAHKNATGNYFTWSNLEITYEYTEVEPPKDASYMKYNGSWREISAFYKKISGAWTLQSDMETLPRGSYVFAGYYEGPIGVETEITDSQFAEDATIVTANYPYVVTIGDFAFSSCDSLTTANFPSAISTGEESFSYCRQLTSANFPSLETIGTYCFFRCELLTMIDLPSVKTIGDAAFYHADALETLIIRNTQQVCTLDGTYVLKYTPIANGTGYIYVPRALLNSYKNAANWSTYSAQFRALEDYTVDGTITGELDYTKI